MTGSSADRPTSNLADVVAHGEIIVHILRKALNAAADKGPDAEERDCISGTLDRNAKRVGETDRYLEAILKRLLPSQNSSTP